MALTAAAKDHGSDPAAFREDLMNIAMTTLSSKLQTHEKDHFAKLAVDAILRLKGSNNLEHIQMIKKQGGSLRESYLEEGFILEKSIGVGQPKRIENANILVANTSMDTDKIKVCNHFHARITRYTLILRLHECLHITDLWFSSPCLGPEQGSGD